MSLRATRIDRYVLRQLVLGLVAVTVGLAALIWLTQSLRFVELVVNRGLSFRVFLQLTSLLLPNFVAIILPIGCFVVVLFVYQRLAGDRELTVMRAAGLSPVALSRPAVVLACLAMVVWHFYHVIFDPDIYPLNTACWNGRVSEEWQKHEHPLDEQMLPPAPANSNPGQAESAEKPTKQPTSASANASDTEK